MLHFSLYSVQNAHSPATTAKGDRDHHTLLSDTNPPNAIFSHKLPVHAIPPLIKAVEDHDLQTAVALFAKKVNVNQCHPILIETPLYIAVKTIQADFVRLLLQNKASVNTLCGDLAYKTALDAWHDTMHAYQQADHDTLQALETIKKALISHGATRSTEVSHR